MEASWRRVLRCTRGGLPFEEFLERAGIDSTDVVLACSEDSAEEFRKGVLAITSGLTPPATGSWADVVFGFREQLDVLFEVARAMGPAAAAENARELASTIHLGGALQRPHAPLAPPVTRHWRAAARSRTPSARLATAAPVDTSGTPSLRALEADLKHQWVSRLMAIHERAGAVARVTDDLKPAALIARLPVQELLENVLGRGAWRTLRGHVRAWERFEAWAGGDAYPPSSATLVAYAACLRRDGCGPSVIPAFRATVGWVCRRIGMAEPDTASEALLAIEASVVEVCGRELREAPPMHVEFLRALELLIPVWAAEERWVRVVRTWQVLCMAYSSMRFDDALHVRPLGIAEEDHAIFMTAWQTKVDRKRRGTKFAVPRVGLTPTDWLDIGMRTYSKVTSEPMLRADFWLAAGTVDTVQEGAPMDYNGFALLLKSLGALVLEANPAGMSDSVMANVRESLEHVTCHSPRVTMVDLMAHAGADGQVLKLQGNWTCDAMPAKYILDRKAIPVHFISQLMADMRSSFQPSPPSAPAEVAGPETEVVVQEPAEVSSATEVCFWESVRAETDMYWNLKFHVISAKAPDKLACNVLPLARCRPLGSGWPGRGTLCERCASARPEAALLEHL